MPDNTMKKHYVVFESPGTFFHESTTREIDSWGTDLALLLANEIVERYGARPFAFHFATRERGESDFDSKQTATSGRYYLGGRILSLEDVERDMPDEHILISNMRGNGWDRVVINENSYRIIQPLGKDDVVLDVKLPKLEATNG